jgi:hypothetical protein
MTTPQRQFEQGLITIHNALETALNQQGVHNFSISYTTLGSTPRDSTFAVSANGQTREKRFTREEIEDSARTIESFAAIKVRMLVNNFTG